MQKQANTNKWSNDQVINISVYPLSIRRISFENPNNFLTAYVYDKYHISKVYFVWFLHLLRWLIGCVRACVTVRVFHFLQSWISERLPIAPNERVKQTAVRNCQYLISHFHETDVSLFPIWVFDWQMSPQKQPLQQLSAYTHTHNCERKKVKLNMSRVITSRQI